MPTSGTVLPSGDAGVAVDFDATGLTDGQTYTTTLRISSNDPFEPVVDVSAVLTVCTSVSGLSFAVDPTAPEVGQPVTFTAAASGTEPVVYIWDFGDNSGGGGKVVSHSYAVSATYTVVVTATNCDGTAEAPYQEDVRVAGMPDIDVSPAALNVSLDPGGMTSRTLTIGNVGTRDLTWAMVETPTVDWLSADPVSGTVLQSDSASITVSFDAFDGLDVGIHTTTLRIESNDLDEPAVDLNAILTVNCVSITGVGLVITNTGTIYTDTLVYFSADVFLDDAAKPYTYQLTIDNVPGSVIASSADPLVLSHTFATTGSHTVEIAAWNCDMTAPVTKSVWVEVSEYDVCVDLNTITITGHTVGDPGIYTFTTSYLPRSASLPIDYVWDNGDTTTTSVRSLDVNTYTLAVTATNCIASLVTDTHEIAIGVPDCPHPLSDASVEGSTSGYTGMLYTFVSVITPVGATEPVIYTWSPEPASGQGTVSADYGWAVPGIHAITLTVENCGGSVDAHHTISIIPPDTGLRIDIPIGGYTTTVEIPAGAVTRTTTFSYTSFTTAPGIPAPEGFVFAGRGFDLNAYQAGQIQIPFDFVKPVTITVRYSDDDVETLREETLALYYRSGDAWSTDGITVVGREVDGNHLVVMATHLTEFALFGQAREYQVYLPIVLRQ